MAEGPDGFEKNVPKDSSSSMKVQHHNNNHRVATSNGLFFFWEINRRKNTVRLAQRGPSPFLTKKGRSFRSTKSVGPTVNRLKEAEV